MDKNELWQVLEEAASLVMTWDEATSPSARMANYVRVARVYRSMRQASMREIDRFKKRLRSGKPVERERMSDFVSGVELLLHHAVDSVAQIAEMAANEAGLHDPSRN